MPEEQEKFLFVVHSMLKVVMFEHWLRFYFMTEMTEETGADAGGDEAGKTGDNEPRLFLLVPEKAMKNIAELFPEYLPMASALNNQEMSFAMSQQAICSYIAEHIDGKLVARDTSPSIMDSMAYQVQQELFSTWIELHEDQLAETFVPFDKWLELFDAWKESKPAKELAEKLVLARQGHAPVSDQ